MYHRRISMITFIGTVLSVISKILPDTAFNYRRNIVINIMSQHTFGYMEKMSLFGKVNLFLKTMSADDKKKILASLDIPEWGNQGVFKGII
jgi:hypothetical protein